MKHQRHTHPNVMQNTPQFNLKISRSEYGISELEFDFSTVLRWHLVGTACVQHRTNQNL